jgi:hypothetical protein
MQITRFDPFSGRMNTLELDVTDAQIEEWQNGALIQNVMPHLTPDEREFLITGITSESWDKYVK